MVDPGFEKLNKKVDDLENRLSSLENKFESEGFRDPVRLKSDPETISISKPRPKSGDEDSFESRVGEYGMAWLGNIVLFFGILFLAQFMRKSGNDILSVAFSIAAVGGIYLTGHLTRKKIPYMSLLFNYNAHLLLFLAALRIHFFSDNPISENAFLGHGLVLVVLASLVYLAYKQKSQILLIIVWILALVTVIASSSTHFILPLMVAISGISLLITYRFGWWTSLIVSIIVVYLAFLIWMLNNPFMSGSLEVISDHQFGYVYLFASALLYSMLGLLPKSDKVPEHLLNFSIVLNGLGFSVIFMLMTLSFFSENYFIYFGLIAAFCVGYSIWLKLRSTWKAVSAMYAIYSFVALSICIAGIYNFPLAFYLLAIQSLLVVSMALWFRSRFIVIMNAILFMGLLFAYLITPDSVDTINFSFALVALVTARILNWKKKRLEIRTELIRNIYLFAGAGMVLYSLHNAVSAQFVTLSWALTALLFFLLSVLIHNKKYRWLAIITMLVTVFYLFIVDLKNISLGYRIVALMFIALIALGISLFYARRQKKEKEDNDLGPEIP